MDKREGISPLTPCRQVGLCRKRSAKNSPWKLSCPSSDIASPTSANAGSIKGCLLTDIIASDGNIQVHSSKSDTPIEFKTLGNNERRDNSNKRKSATPCGKSITKKILCRNSGDTNSEETKIEKISFDDEKPLLVINDFPGKSENDSSVRSDTSMTIPVTPTVRKKEEAIKNINITATELSTLRERIASKEKKLKELKLSALYKKKHNHEQVAKETETWLQACKEALTALQSELAKRDQIYSVAQLLKTLGIPSSLLEIDDDSD